MGCDHYLVYFAFSPVWLNVLTNLLVVSAGLVVLAVLILILLILICRS
jgi:hypothetical protein